MINLCWYFWGGGLSPFRGLEDLNCLKYWQTGSTRGLCTLFRLDRICYLKKRDCPPTQSTQSTLFELTEKELAQFIAYLHYHFITFNSKVSLSWISDCFIPQFLDRIARLLDIIDYKALTLRQTYHVALLLLFSFLWVLFFNHCIAMINWTVMFPYEAHLFTNNISCFI